MEYFEGITLAEYVKKKGSLNENETKIIMKQVISTLRYCHAKRISHRDIKPENILINDNLEIKLIDFAFSVKLNSKKGKIKGNCGTPNFMAPEVFSKEICSPFKADIWALGVLFIKLKTGKLPFSGKLSLTKYLLGKCRKELGKLIKERTINEKCLEKIPPEMKKLILNLLDLDPEKRLWAKELLVHSYFKTN